MKRVFTIGSLTSLTFLAACGSSVHTNASPTDGGGTPSSDSGGSPLSDSGSTSKDSGGPGHDAGAPGHDAGSPGVDAGSTSYDAGPPPQYDASATGQWVLGYYVDYLTNEYPIASIDWTGISHIVFTRLTLNSDLSLNISPDTGTGAADAKTISTAAHANGVKALLMLGGAGEDLTPAVTPSTLPAFVTALSNAMTTYGYDGIDLDWENGINLDSMVSLAQALRKANPTMILTYPGPVLYGATPTVDTRYVTLAAVLDRFNVQSYYPTTAMVGSGWDSWFVSPLHGESGSTPVAIDATLAAFAAAGIPKAKLGMGTAFYAICYPTGITGPMQPTSSGGISGGDNSYPLTDFYAAGSTFANSTPANQLRDEDAGEPYLSFPSPTSDSKCGSTQYISYEDETSLIAKGTFSKANGYGGIIIWTINEGWLPSGAAGGRAPNAIMQALKTGFLQ